jgi:hypothetical protein
MENQQPNGFFQNFLPVISGVMSALGSAFLLLPLVRKVFEKFYHPYIFESSLSDAQNDALIIKITIAAWFFISASIGGYFCSLISKSSELIHILISSLVSIALFFFLSKTEVSQVNISSFWFLILAIPLGNFFGGWLGSRHKASERKT